MNLRQTCSGVPFRRSPDLDAAPLAFLTGKFLPRRGHGPCTHYGMIGKRLWGNLRGARLVAIEPPGTTHDIMENNGLIEAFLAFRAALMRHLAIQGATPDEAEDILQDISLKISDRQPDGVEQPKAYLYRMVQNHFILHRRSAGRRARRDEAWVGANTGDPPEIDETPSVETRMIAREQLAMLQATLDRLPERTRTIFRRFRIDGVPQRHIAAETGISVSAVEKHLARAYEAIAAKRRRMDEAAAGPRHLRNEETLRGK